MKLATVAADESLHVNVKQLKEILYSIAIFFCSVKSKKSTYGLSFGIHCQQITCIYCKGGVVATVSWENPAVTTGPPDLTTCLPFHVVWLPLLTTTKLVHTDPVFALCLLPELFLELDWLFQNTYMT